MLNTSSPIKVAIVVLSDPKAGEEALGRAYNALAAAYDFRTRGHGVQILFQGAGTRWPEQLVREEHPAHALFQQVRESILGASHACAIAFDALDGLDRCGLDLIQDNNVPGTAGLPSLANLVHEGALVLIF